MDSQESDERWVTITEFPNYLISTHGRIWNDFIGRLMKTSRTKSGHVKITLRSDWDNTRYTRSVALLVGKAFVENPRPLFFNAVMLLDNNLSNVRADNIVWRPAWYVWKYSRQFKEEQPRHYHNLPVRNDLTGEVYPSIIAAGTAEHQLFEDIWKSTYDGIAYIPNQNTWSVVSEGI